MRYLLVFTALIFCLGANPSVSKAQYSDGDIILAEFFDDVVRVNLGSQTVTDLYEPGEQIFPHNFSVFDSGTAYFSEFGEIWRLQNDTITLLTEVEGTNPEEITKGLDGNIVFANSNGISQIDVSTGEVSLRYDQTFFGVDDLVVSSSGDIFATEFFDGLGRLSTNNVWHKLGDWEANFFSHVDLGPDGFLYLSTTFEDGDIYKVNPNNGEGIKIADNVFTFIDDLQVASDGTIYLAGAANTDDDATVEDAVLAIDPITGEVTVVVDENMVGDPNPPFFNPLDIDVVNFGFRSATNSSAVPEPGSFLVLVLGATGGLLLRRRS